MSRPSMLELRRARAEARTGFERLNRELAEARQRIARIDRAVAARIEEVRGLLARARAREERGPPFVVRDALRPHLDAAARDRGVLVSVCVRCWCAYDLKPAEGAPGGVSHGICDQCAGGGS